MSETNDLVTARMVLALSQNLAYILENKELMDELDIDELGKAYAQTTFVMGTLMAKRYVQEEIELLEGLLEL
jgi:uncharacterized membrane protein affecting hemolysin expression